MRNTFLACLATAIVIGSAAGARADRSILNVSYDPTRELYRAYNQYFATKWQSAHHEAVTVQQSHGGSGKQARSVIDGLEADVVTLAVPVDVAAIRKAGLINAGWQKRFKSNSAPYTSTIVFLVRKGNPKHIKDWNDLVRPGVQVITANPKTGGGARVNYLAAWGYALKQPGGSQNTARGFVSRLYHNVPVMDSGARGSTNTFVHRHIGDVLIAWENEALQTAYQASKGQVEIVVPSISILAEPPVAIVDKNVDKHKTRDVATAYISWLYSPEGQDIVARNYYRPRLASVARKYAGQFAKVRLFDIGLFGGWEAAQQTHFADGGIFDQIFRR